MHQSLTCSLACSLTHSYLLQGCVRILSTNSHLRIIQWRQSNDTDTWPGINSVSWHHHSLLDRNLSISCIMQCWNLVTQGQEQSYCNQPFYSESNHQGNRLFIKLNAFWTTKWKIMAWCSLSRTNMNTIILQVHLSNCQKNVMFIIFTPVTNWQNHISGRTNTNSQTFSWWLLQLTL